MTALPESGEPEAFFEQLFEAAAEGGAEDVRVVQDEDEKADVVYEVGSCLPRPGIIVLILHVSNR